MTARSGGVIAPMSLILLEGINPIAPYVMLMILCLGCLITSLSLPVETRGMELDKVLGVKDHTSSKVEEFSMESYGALRKAFRYRAMEKASGKSV